METSLIELIDMVKDVAPDLWRIGLQQVKAVLIGDIVGVLLLALLTAIGIFFFLRVMRKAEEDHYGEYGLWLFLIGVGTFVVGMPIPWIIAGIIRMGINPEFYAIEKLLGLIK